MNYLRALGAIVGMLVRLWLWMAGTALRVDAKERELLGRAWER